MGQKKKNKKSKKISGLFLRVFVLVFVVAVAVGSDAYIEQIAREQLGMVKSNEILYINRGE